MTLVFNELSASDLASTTYGGREMATNMVQAIADLVGDRAAKLIAVDSFDLFAMRLAGGYTLHDWLTDKQVDRDQRELLWTISTKVAFEQDVSEAVRDRFFLSEFLYNNQEAAGLGLSYLIGTAAVSLRSHERWVRIYIGLRHLWIDDEGEHQLDVEALNIADGNQANEVSDELLKRAQDELAKNSTRLAGRKQECFPHLAFGVDVDDQLSVLSGDVIEQVIGKLIVLDAAVRDWRRNASESPVISVRPESKPTMQKYGDLRVFRDRYGNAKEYRSHATVGSYRIHLFVDQRNRVLEIGYIGKHLPTVKFPD